MLKNVVRLVMFKRFFLSFVLLFSGIINAQFERFALYQHKKTGQLVFLIGDHHDKDSHAEAQSGFLHTLFEKSLENVGPENIEFLVEAPFSWSTAQDKDKISAEIETFKFGGFLQDVYRSYARVLPGKSPLSACSVKSIDLRSDNHRTMRATYVYHVQRGSKYADALHESLIECIEADLVNVITPIKQRDETWLFKFFEKWMDYIQRDETGTNSYFELLVDLTIVDKIRTSNKKVLYVSAGDCHIENVQRYLFECDYSGKGVEWNTVFTTGQEEVSHPEIFENSLFEKLDKKCSLCGNGAAQSCAQCKVVSYCGRKCQVRDWKSGHKDKCKQQEEAAAAAAVQSVQQEEAVAA